MQTSELTEVFKSMCSSLSAVWCASTSAVELGTSGYVTRTAPCGVTENVKLGSRSSIQQRVSVSCTPLTATLQQRPDIFGVTWTQQKQMLLTFFNHKGF
jgi:hypothetical protein